MSELVSSRPDSKEPRGTCSRSLCRCWRATNCADANQTRGRQPTESWKREGSPRPPPPSYPACVCSEAVVTPGLEQSGPGGQGRHAGLAALQLAACSRKSSKSCS